MGCVHCVFSDCVVDGETPCGLCVDPKTTLGKT